LKAMRIGMLAMSCALSSAWAAGAEDEVARLAQQNFVEYLELLSLPNIPATPADMQRNADFLERSFRKRGFETQRLDNPAGRPVILAQLPKPRANAKTILFYMHFDGQPVIPQEWAQSSPFEPVVKERNDQGEWQAVKREKLLGSPLNRELRVFARSSSDDKAPIMMLLTAMDMLRAQRRAPAVNIKVLLDPEEEIGSPHLATTVAENRALFKADALVVLDGPLHNSGRPTLAFGNRGITQVSLTVFGPRAPLHSGHFGNYVPNPAQRLATLLASMKDDTGRVLIPGYYDGVDLTAADREVLRQTGDDEAAIRKRVGIARAESVGSNYQESLQYPSLNVRGMAAAAVGDKVANIVPSEAVAEIDIRTAPETDGRRLFELIKGHIEKQGYHLVDAAPTDEERARYDKLAMLRLGGVQTAERMPMDSPIGRWALEALKSASGPEPGKDPVRIRMMGGTVPTDVLVEALQLPFILVPTVNADNNQHTHDENLRMGNFVTGTQTIYSLFNTRYAR
jgi:acetylornithine deacetylase/succinyl-diaminopimelate desuccinylase-like protein